MRYQVLTFIFLGMIISLSAMNCEYVSRFGESNTSMRLNNILIDNGKLYLCKEYGVDIFEISESGNLELITTIEVDDTHNFALYNNYLFISCYPFGGDTWNTTVYEYDVSDPEQPVETGQLELDYPPYSMYIWHDMLTIVDYILTRQLLYYDRETLEYIDNEEGEFLKPFYGDYWCSSDPDILTIYDLSDPFNAEVVTFVDLEPVANDRSQVCRRISDELYVVYSQLEMSLWDTYDFADWQLLSQFPFPDYEILFYDLNIVIWDNKILLPLVEQTLVVDISDPELPAVSQILYLDLINPTNCKKYGDHIYLVDNSHGIQILDVDENEVLSGEISTEFTKQGNGLMYENNIIRESTYHFQSMTDFYIWDITDPGVPQINAEIDLGTGRADGKVLSDLLIVKNMEDLNIEIYDISGLPDLSLTGSIDCFENLYEFSFGNFYVFENEIDKIYIKIPPERFVCYDISDLQNQEVLFEITEDNCFIGNKFGDYLYLVESYSSDGIDLIVYSGINCNEPQLAARYVNFMPVHCVLKLYHNKLCVSNDLSTTTQVYELNGSEEPEMLCNLNVDFGGGVIYFGGEYLVCSIYDAYGFYIPANPLELIEPSCHIGRFNFICNLEVISSDTEYHLYVFDTAYTEIYQVVGTGNYEDSITESIQMISYPNPFSFDNGKDIRFYSQNAPTRYCEDALLSVYNIKGQLVYRQEVDFRRDGDLYWDCRLERGTKAPSGVYLYKVDAGKESSVGKFTITK
jgi:hypothetical protein